MKTKNITSWNYKKPFDNLPQSLKSIYLNITCEDEDEDLKYDLTKLPQHLIYFMCHSPNTDEETLSIEVILPSNFICYRKLSYDIEDYKIVNGGYIGGYTISSSGPENILKWQQLNLTKND